MHPIATGLFSSQPFRSWKEHRLKLSFSCPYISLSSSESPRALMIHFCDRWNVHKGFRKLRYLRRFLDFSLFHCIKSWNRLGVNWSHEFMPEKIFTSSHMLAVHLVWHLVWDLCFSKYFQRIHTHGTSNHSPYPTTFGSCLERVISECRRWR